jgi:hypothetical protein
MIPKHSKSDAILEGVAAECPCFKERLKQLRSGLGCLGIATNDPATLFDILENSWQQ